MTISELVEEHRFLAEENLRLRMDVNRLEAEKLELEEIIFTLATNILMSPRGMQ